VLIPADRVGILRWNFQFLRPCVEFTPEDTNRQPDGHPERRARPCAELLYLSKVGV